MDNLREVIFEAVMDTLNEIYRDSATPIHSRTRRNDSMGINPLTVDIGNRPTNDILRQASTEDFNGAAFDSRGNDISLSDNKFIIYKIKNFGNDTVKGTLSLFGQGSNGEKELRRAIDIINGAARRNGRYVSYRTISAASNKTKRRNDVNNTFWEFSMDGGETWYILKPEPIQNMRISKLINK